MMAEWITEQIMVYRDAEDTPVFQNRRGIMVNGNRRIHMANWKLEDLEAIVAYLKRQAEQRQLTNEDLS